MLWRFSATIEMLAKWLPEKENEALSVGNLALKLKNSDIKDIFIKSVHESNNKRMMPNQLKNAEKIPKKLGE